MMQNGLPPGGVNPDQGADYEEICNVMEEKLVPVFDMIGKEIHDLHEDQGELQELVFKLLTSVIGAADGHRRDGLSQKLMGKYGSDIEPLDGFMQDTQGKKFSDELIDSLMGDGAPEDDEGIDGLVQSKLGEAKGKYGKYLGMMPPPPPGGEVKMEVTKGELPPEAAAAPDAVTSMMDKLGGLARRGK
jgi:hypothetical protein